MFINTKMWSYIAIGLISASYNCITSGQTTIPDHFLNQNIESSILRFLLDEIKNLKSDLHTLRMNLKEEQERRLLLEREVDVLKNESRCDNKHTSEILQLSRLTFELDLELKQQRNDTMVEILKLRREFNTIMEATTTTFAGGIATVPDIKTKIYFTAATSTDIDRRWMADEIIIFAHVISSEGGGYDPSTGIFTAPQNGIYVFMCHLASIDDGYIAKLVVNNVPKVGVAAPTDHGTITPDTKTYSAAGNSVFLHLEQGDRVWMAHYENPAFGSIWTHVYYPYSTFSGYLLN